MRAHVYDGERCLFCGANMIDQIVYGGFPCVEREPLKHTSESEAQDDQ